MIILSNAFFTNMPHSEVISQGGPANFARLFKDYISTLDKPHKWVGILMEKSDKDKAYTHKKYSAPNRVYYNLYVPRKTFENILQAKDAYNADKVLNYPIEKLSILMKKQKPDVVFLNGFGLLNWMLLKAANRIGIPVVIQHAGIWTKELNIHKDLYTKYGLQIMKNMEKDSTYLSDTEIFLNKWSMNFYLNNVAKGPVNNRVVIPLPFNFHSFKEMIFNNKSSLFKFDKEKLNIGIVARWDKIKNHNAFLNLAEMAYEHKLPWNFHSIVNIPNIQKYKRIKNKYKKYINIIPPMNRLNISNFYKSIDLLILPSVFDVSPTVVLEAIASNTPIIISPNVGFTNEFYNHGGKDWIIDPSNTKQLIKKIKLLKNKKMPAQLKKHIISIHDNNKVFSAYIDLFSEMKNKLN